MTPERREEVMGQVEEMHQEYVKEAAPILNEDQLTKYEENLGKQRNDLDGFLKFTHDMSSAGEKKEEEEAPAP